MLSPETYLLRQVEWQFFCTLTFEGRVRSADDMRRAAHAWLRDVGFSYRKPWHSQLWALRMELGEKFGRPHFHSLLAGLCDRGVSLRELHRVRVLWARRGFGFAMVRRFENGSDGVDYMLKPSLAEQYADAKGLTLCALKGSDRSFAGADSYEMGKFASPASELQIAHAVWRHVAEKRGFSVSVGDVGSWSLLKSGRLAS